MDVIVVASSEPSIQETLKMLLAEEYALVTVSTLPELMDALVEQPADVVILDEFLGNADGASVFTRMCSISQDTTCIMLSVQPNSSVARDMRGRGVYDIVSKPFDANELMASVERAIERSRLMTRLAAAETKREQPPAVPHPQAASDLSFVHRREMLDSLRKFLKASAGTLEPQRLHEFVLETVAEMFSINRATLLLNDRESQSMRIVASIGLSSRLLRGCGAASWQGIAGWFRKNDQILDLDIPDAHAFSDEAIEAKKELKLLQSRLCLPLIADGRLIGALVVGKKMTGRTLSDSEIELLCMLSQQIAAMIENARRHHDVFVQKEKFEGILQGVNSGLFATDSEGRVTVFNRTAEQILGLEASRVLGKSVQRIGSVFADIVFRSLQEEKSLCRHEVVDPATKTLLGISTSLLTDSAGKPIGAVALFTDLSTVTRSGAAGAEDAWQQCALRLAHEIKNPLVAVHTFAQLFPKSYNDEKFRDEFGEIAIGEIHKLDRVVERLLRFAEPLTPRSQPDDIHAVLDEEIEKVGEKTKSLGISVRKDFRFKNGKISFDRNLLGEAFEQVLANAVDAMPSGGTLSVSTASAIPPDASAGSPENGTPTRDIAEISIADTGVGIAPEEIPNLFKPFHTGKLKGMGLGLPITRRIIAGHRGNITIASEVNKGTTVKIVLPYGATENG